MTASTWAWRVWLAVWSCLAVAYLGLSSDGQTVLYDTFAVGAFVAIAIAVRWHRPPRRATWLTFGLGALAIAAGEIVFNALPETAFPSPADALYIAGYLLLAVALAGFVRDSRVRSAPLLDAAIVMVAAIAMMWTLVVSPLVEHGQGSPSELAITLIYPTLDLLLIWFLVRATLAGGRRNMSLGLMAAGFAAFLVSDIWYGALEMSDGYVPGIADLGWLIGYALWGAAALHPTMAHIIEPLETPGQLSTRRLALLGCAAIVPAVMALTEQTLRGHIHPMPVILGSLIMFGLIVLRLFGVLQEQRDLLTAHARLQRSLERLAQEDPLTGLTNRRGFLERLTSALERDAGRVAVLFLDLDDFKTVNDSFGHPAGDDVLRNLGRRLTGAIRAGDTAARLGGDEFAVLIEDCARPEAAQDVAQRLLRALAAPMSIGDANVSAKSSIGIALGASGADDAASLMGSADFALYRAKAAGEGRVELFDSALHRDALVAMAIRSGLASAAERGQLIVQYQPIVALAGRRPIALEALVRWNHPDLGFLMPGAFLQLAESTGQMEGIGRWVLGQACRDAGAWIRAGHPDVAVNVNVSPSQLRSGMFVSDVMRALQESRLAPRLLTLELTEAALEGTDEASSALTELATLGVRLAIDDFGTGYSSLSRVGQMPVSELKMDRSLLAGDQRMLGAVAELGRALGLRLVAEGIETAAELALAERIGCDAAQGFLFGMAVAADQLERVLDRPEHAGSDRRRTRLRAVPAGGS